MAGNKELIINFKLNGVEQSTQSIDTLNSKVGNLNSTFQGTNKNVVDLNGNILIGGKQASEQFVVLDNTTKNVGNTLNEVGEKSKSFGGNLEKSTKSAGQGVNALANGLQLVGVQNDNIQKVAGALQVLAGLMKSQEVLSRTAFSNKGVVDQTKALGELSQVKKADITLTEGAALANKGLAVAEGQAAVGAKGLGTSFKALQASLGIFGLIALAIGAIVTAFSLWKDAQENAALKTQENLEKEIELLKEVGQLTLTQIEHETALLEIKAQNNLAVAERQLEIMKLQNVSLAQQYAQEQNIVKLKQDLLQEQLNKQYKIGGEIKLQIQDQNAELIKQQKIINDNNLSEEEQLKAKEKEHELEKSITQLNQQLSGVAEKKTEIQNQLTLSKETDNKLLDLQYKKELQILATQREEYLNALRLRELTTKEELRKIKFDVESEDLQKDLKFIQDEIKKIEGNKVDINITVTKDDLIFEKLINESKLELKNFTENEESKRKELIKTSQEKINSNIKAIAEIQNSTATQEQKDKDILKFEQEIAVERRAIEEINNVFLVQSLKKRGEIIETFNKNVLANDLILQKTREKLIQQPVEGTGPVQEPASINKADVEDFELFKSQVEQRKKIFSQFIDYEINEAKRSTDNQEIINKRILKLEEDRKNKTIDDNGEIILDDNIISKERTRLHEKYVNEVKTTGLEILDTQNEIIDGEYNKLNTIIIVNNKEIASIQNTILEDKKRLANINISAQEREKINNRINISNQRVAKLNEENNKQIAQSNTELTNKQIQLFEDYRKRVNEVNKEVTKSLEGKNLTFSQLIELDIDFKEFDEQFSKSINQAKQSITNESKDLFEPIQIQIDNFNKKLENGSGINLGFILRESKSISNQYKEAADKFIKDIEAKRKDLLDALDKKQSSDKPLNSDEFEKEKAKINRVFDEVVKNVEDGSKDIKKSLTQNVIKTLNNIHQVASEMSSIVLDALQAINDAEDARTERKINSLENEFAIREQFLQDEIDRAQEVADEKAQIAEDANSKINQIENQLSGARGQRQRYLLALLDEERIRKDKAAKEEQKAKDKAAAEQKKLDDEKKAKDDEVKQLQKEATIRQLKLSRTTAIVQGAMGAVGAFAQAVSTIPPPAGAIIGAIEAAAIAAVTALQVDAINQQIETAQQAKMGGELVYSIKDNEGKIVHASGGVVQGPSHEEGGVKGTGKFNNIEVEGGEFIIRKDSTKNNLDVIKQLNEEGANKKFSLVPMAQSQSKMATGGLLPNFANIEKAVSTANNTPQPVFQDLQPIVDAIARIQPVIGIKQFADAEDELVRIKNFATV